MLTRCALAIGLVGWLSTAASAQAPATLSVDANPTSLGAIPPAPSSTTCSTRSVTFTVSLGLEIQSATVSVTIDHQLFLLGISLIAPTGDSHELFQSVPYSSLLQGTYTFANSAVTNFYAAAQMAPTSLIAPGSYRPTAGSIDATFAGRNGAGRWVLRIQNCWQFGTGGAVTGARLVFTGTPKTEARVSPGTLGGIPDGSSGATTQTPGPSRDVTFVVPPGTGPVRTVRVAAFLKHPHLGDVVARLIAPDGRSHVLFGYTGATSNTSAGSTSVLNGLYGFSDDAPFDWWVNAGAFPGLTLPSGDFRTSEIGGSGSAGAVTSMNTTFAGAPADGIWTLRLTDGFAGSVGSVDGASLTIESATTPTSRADSYAIAFETSLVVGAPGVLANDSDNLGGALTSAVVSAPMHGLLALAPSGAFTYTPTIGFAGTDSFTYRAVNAGGPGTVASVSIVVAAPVSVQPPTEFRASSVSGNQVTLRWKPPAVGPAAADYLIEGGVAPGQVLGAVAVGGPLPILTFAAPTGAFYIRVHAIDGAGQRSGPSNEIRVFVNTPAAPSAPTSLTASAIGDSFALSWRDTFAGGAPTGTRLDVTGSATASQSLPLTETSWFSGVPAGTYTFRVRATNAAGTSTSSAPVTVTLPASCSGAPAPPADVLAYAVGRVVHVVWDPPSTGAAPVTYVLHVGGSFTGTFPLAGRNLSAPAPPGTYALSLSAVNPCGASAQTAPQTVFVP